MLSTKDIQAVFNAIPIPCLVLMPDAPDFTIIGANEAFCQISQTCENKLVDKALGAVNSIFNMPENGNAGDGPLITGLAPFLRKTSNTQTPQEITIQIPPRNADRKNGIYWHLKSKPITGENGGISLILLTLSDVTEQENQKKALDKSLAENKLYQANITEIHQKIAGERDLLRAILDNLPDFIFVKDRERRQIINNKKLYTEIFGTDSEEGSTGKTMFEHFDKELATMYDDDDRKVLETGEAVIDRKEFIYDKNGGKKWLLTSKMPLFDEGNNIIGLIGISRDITEEHHLEKERQLIAEVIETLHTFGNLTGSLHQVIKLIARHIGYQAAEAWLVSSGGNLRLNATWKGGLKDIETTYQNPNEYLEKGEGGGRDCLAEQKNRFLAGYPPIPKFGQRGLGRQIWDAVWLRCTSVAR